MPANEGDGDADDFDGADADDDNCDDRDDVPCIKSGEGSVGELMREAAEKENGSHREIGLDRCYSTVLGSNKEQIQK